MTDEEYMELAIRLAKKATGYTSPNPLVGALVVKNGKIIGQGYHHKAGTHHAEVHALHEAGLEAKGATLYVTLEPCAHYGKTPPCANLVVESGISKVVIGSGDPNPLVAGKGVAILERGGIQVIQGVLEKECQSLNEMFFTFIQKKIPFVTLKSAMSLDGKIATKSGESQWITNESARNDGHMLRGSHDCILVGIGTILADNPQLNCRHGYLEKPHQPDVVILDSQGRTPENAKVFLEKNRKILIMVSPNCSPLRIEALERVGAEVIKVSSHESGLDLLTVLHKLGERDYISILVEGGARIIGSFVDQRCFNKLITYIGNQIIGNQQALSAIGGNGVSALQDAPLLEFATIELLDNNVKIIAYKKEREVTNVHRNH